MKFYLVVPCSSKGADQKIDQRLAKSHLPGQHLDIALVRGQYLDTALEAGQYKMYCPAKTFDPPMQSITYYYT